jgi:dTDP-4-dehydrorhamnose 3,5-epimerase
MEFIKLENKNKIEIVKDVLLYPLKINNDESGVLVETLRKDWPQIYGPGREFFMQYYSVTDSGVARDEDVWHYHPTYQEDRFLVAQGKIVVAVADNREDSSTKGLLNLFLMEAYNNPYILLIPKRTLHGFMVVSKEKGILLNYPTGLYNPDEEGRISYSEVNVKFSDGNLFSWKVVKDTF